MVRALKVSCNLYFANLGIQLGAERLHRELADRFGLRNVKPVGAANPFNFRNVPFTADSDSGTLTFSTIATRPKKSHNERNSYVGIAEYLAAYLPANGKVYMIPVSNAPRNTAVLRFRECGPSSSPRWRDNGGKSPWWAEDYEI